MSKKPLTAAQLRKLDRQIVELVNLRAEGERIEGATGDGEWSLTFGAIRKVVESNAGPLPDRTIEAIFRELASGIRTLNAPLRVAYLGPEHTYSHLAALAHFGHGAEFAPVSSIAAVFEEVARRQCQFGVVPIENSTDGRVADSLEWLSRLGSAPAASGRPNANEPRASPDEAASPLQICAEVPLRIRHCLIGRGRRADIQYVSSKPQALSQCRNWLASHLPGVKLEPASSTAEAAASAVADERRAAICGEQAAANYDLKVLARNIEDNPDNVTRFAVIGNKAAPRTGRDKTALVFEAPHQPGALADAMAIFKRARLNLTWIESFPVPQARGRYLFFVEFQGHSGELRAKRAIAALERKSLRLAILGSYAEAEVVG